MFGLLDKLLGGQATEDAPPMSEPHLAAAALLLEAASADGSFETVERQRIDRLLADRFGLGPFAAGRLVEEARRQTAERNDWQGFTRVLKEAYDHEGRIAIVEMLWEVVLADGTLDDFEASLMRQIPALLYVSDRENADARSTARARLEGQAQGQPTPPVSP